jgi:hypothetical protein
MTLTAQDPLPLVTMALADSKGDISQMTRCGLTGLASAFARPSSFFHQSRATLVLNRACNLTIRRSHQPG